MTKPYHLYVVEDDNPLRTMLCDYLEKQGLVVTGMALSLIHISEPTRPY